VTLEDGSLGRAAIPPASTGTLEAVELRDGDKARFGGKGVLKAVRRSTATFSMRWAAWMPKTRSHRRCLITLDGTPNKARLGAMHSGRVARRRQGCADASGLPLYRYVGGVMARVLPVPQMNILNGGVHADNPIDFQEFMILPIAHPPEEAVRWGSEVFHFLKSALKRQASTPMSATRRLCAESSSAERHSTFASRPSRSRLQACKDIALGLDPARANSSKTGLRLHRRRQEPLDRGTGALSRQARRHLSHHQHRGWNGEDDCRDGRLDRSHRRQIAARRRRYLRHQCRTARRRHSKASAIRSSSRSIRSAR